MNKAKDKLEIELAGEKVRSEERQNQVIVCEKALKASHMQTFKLENEIKRLTAMSSRREQLQAAVAQLQTSFEKKAAAELKLRHKIEEELRLYKHNRVGVWAAIPRIVIFKYMYLNNVFFAQFNAL